ncbi:MAG TPA: hypothetical protein VES68_01305, partial [Candidatus Sulfotelmatobacter sp.]|nr:hypothetical protein [Candidatus Sulfotelmatobacter sp.]
MLITNFNFTRFFTRLSIGIIFIILFLNLQLPSHAASGINRFVNFQGKLVNNPLKTNVTDTSYTVVFSIYDKSSGGTTLWTETQTVTTTDGIFRVALGTVTPFPANFNFNWSDLFLGMKVNSDSEMTPRIQLAAVPYAFNAQQVAGLTVQDENGNASTSGTLKIPNAKTVSFAGATAFGSGTTGTITLGSTTNNLTLTTSGDTNLALPTSGTLCTTVSCLASDPFWSHNLGALFPNNSTEDFLIGGQSTNSAIFSVLGASNPNHQTTASISGNLIVMPNNGFGPNVGIGTSNPGARLEINTANINNLTEILLSGGAGLNGTGIKFSQNAVSSSYNAIDFTGSVFGSATQIKAYTYGLSSGSFISDVVSIGNLVSAFTGFGINLSPTKTFTSSSNLTNTGSFLKLARNDTVNNAGLTLTTTGDLANLSSNCTITSGQCIDTSHILSLTQSYASASGSVLFVNNGGSGIALNAFSSGNTTSVASLSGNTSFSTLVVDQSGVGDIFTASAAGQPIFTIAKGGGVGIGTTLPAAKLAITGATADTGINISGITSGKYLTINNLTSGTGIQFNSGLTTGKALDLNSMATLQSGTGISITGNSGSNLPAFTGKYINIDITRDKSTGSSINDTGNFINVNRNFDVNNVGITYTVSGDLVKFSSNCTKAVGGGECIDTGKILSLTQSYSSASGSVLFISNSGKGLAIEANSVGNTTAIASLSGNTSFAGFVIDNSGVGDIFTAS